MNILIFVTARTFACCIPSVLMLHNVSDVELLTFQTCTRRNYSAARVVFQKSQVWEIMGAEFTRSNVHTAGGISIRFPRLSRIRDDKSVKQATDLPQLLVSRLAFLCIISSQRLLSSGWPLTWKTWKSRRILKWSGKMKKVGRL